MERYYLGGNTVKGFCGFYDETLEKIGRVYYLKGGAGTGKSTLMKRLGKEAERRGLDREEWYCSGDPSSLDGVYIKELDLAVVDGTAPHIMDPKLPAVKDKLVNLAEYLDEKKLEENRCELEKLLADKRRCFASAYEYLQVSFAYSNRADRIKRENTDESAVRVFSSGHFAELISRARRCSDKSATKEGRGRDVFARAITPDGEKGFYDCLQDKEIMLVEGRSKRAFFSATEGLRGLGATVLHSSLCPENVEGVILGNFAVVSDAGHYKNVVSEIVDLGVFEKGFDRYAAERAEEDSASAVISAVDYLSQARAFHLELERRYVAAMDFDALNSKTEEVIKEILG